jgi:HSP20 family protein
MDSSRDGVPTREMPLNLYENGHELVAVVPMPGLTPAEIEVRVTEDALVIEGRLRGPGQESRQYLIHEWRYGPYSRSVSLPFPVDAERANVTHGNGVLAVALPKAERNRPGVVRLAESTATGHKAQGHAGREAEPRP